MSSPGARFKLPTNDQQEEKRLHGQAEGRVPNVRACGSQDFGENQFGQDGGEPHGDGKAGGRQFPPWRLGAKVGTSWLKRRRCRYRECMVVTISIALDS